MRYHYHIQSDIAIAFHPYGNLSLSHILCFIVKFMLYRKTMFYPKNSTFLHFSLYRKIHRFYCFIAYRCHAKVKAPNPLTFADVICRSPVHHPICPHIQRFMIYRIAYRSMLKPSAHFADAISQGPYRCDIAIAHRSIAFPIYVWPIAPPPMRYCDLIATVGFALARSNGPDLFSATVVTPALKSHISPAFKCFCLFKGQKGFFTCFSSALAHALKAKEAWSVLQPFLIASAQNSSEQRARPQHSHHYAKSFAIMQYFLLFGNVLIGQRR